MSKFGCFLPILLSSKKKRSKSLDLKSLKKFDPTPLPPDPIPSSKPADIPADPYAYEGGDEHEETRSMNRDPSDLDLQSLAKAPMASSPPRVYETDDVITPDFQEKSGHVSDPGAEPTPALSAPALKRTCSNIETKQRAGKTRSFRFAYEEAARASPAESVRSDRSADRVMLKKRSSSQVLPSRSRKLWWRLFLWSHPLSTVPSERRAGYSSDTQEQTPEKDKKKYQWVAFSADSSSRRVDAWVDSIDETKFSPLDEDDVMLDSAPEEGEGLGKGYVGNGKKLAEEVVQANNVIRSLNSFSSVAHISGMGLKIVPSISAFSGLRSVNLSGNYIVQINSGSLPRSLHTLDLSRNKIAAVEGLRELTRLRILNLSYNKISRIGHGLSNCMLIKELYLAGNKISDVEGLHRLLKLTVLDLSFNKIATAKALGQLVANYNSLLAINLIGNPVQTNMGDDQLRKAVCSLLPNLAYLNKQPIKPQRAREATSDSIAKAALSSGSAGARRRIPRRATQASGIGSSMSGHRHKVKGRHQHTSSTSRK